MTLVQGCLSRFSNPICDLSYLLIDISVFPSSEWKETGSRDIDGAPSRIGMDRAGTSFSTKRHGGAVQHIYRFSSTELANTNYDELKRDWIYIVSHGVSLTEPSELSDIHIGADEYILNCTNDEVERCLLVALYKNDYVEFTIDMASLTYDDLARIIFELDSRMLSCNELE